MYEEAWSWVETYLLRAPDSVPFVIWPVVVVIIWFAIWMSNIFVGRYVNRFHICYNTYNMIGLVCPSTPILPSWYTSFLPSVVVIATTRCIWFQFTLHTETARSGQSVMRTTFVVEAYVVKHSKTLHSDDSVV